MADPFDPRSLAYGINWILEDEERNKKLSLQARLNAKNIWHAKFIGKKIFNDIVGSNKVFINIR